MFSVEVGAGAGTGARAGARARAVIRLCGARAGADRNNYWFLQL
jgi:hypothetical protein